jgi:hypothetical protein
MRRGRLFHKEFIVNENKEKKDKDDPDDRFEIRDPLFFIMSSLAPTSMKSFSELIGVIF